MKTETQKAYAKINLALDVLRKREDGYHDIKMIMQQIDLYDTVTCEIIEENEILIESEAQYVPSNERNIAYKAAKLLKESYGISEGVKISIDKTIPVSAGLAGGSTDAAAVMILLNKLWEINLSKVELMRLGKKIGADVPFCIMGGCAISEGIGDILTPIKGVTAYVVLVKPKSGLSTKKIYEKFRAENQTLRPNIDQMVRDIEGKTYKDLGLNMMNSLEAVAMELEYDIKKIKILMKKFMPIGAMMSGSGPSVFGLFSSKKNAEIAYNFFKKQYKDTYLVKTINR